MLLIQNNFGYLLSSEASSHEIPPTLWKFTQELQAYSSIASTGFLEIWIIYIQTQENT